MRPTSPMARSSLRPLLARVLGGAALLAAASAPVAAQRATDQRRADPGPLGQVAFSLPLPPPKGGATGLPLVLAPADAARLRRIFGAQARGDLATALRETDRLEDRRLLGHVLADRWLRPGASPSAAEVQAWLAEHADHPDALALHELLARLLPRGAPLPAPPQAGEMLTAETSLAPEEREPAGAAIARNPVLDRGVRDRVREGNAEAALPLTARPRGMPPAYAALLRADIAIGLFRAGRDVEALQLAAETLQTAPENGTAAFAAGLAAWGLARWDLALPYFERAA